jgi:hypothetical protein
VLEGCPDVEKSLSCCPPDKLSALLRSEETSMEGFWVNTTLLLVGIAVPDITSVATLVGPLLAPPSVDGSVEGPSVVETLVGLEVGSWDSKDGSDVI